jgi:hypothetical protein
LQERVVVEVAEGLTAVPRIILLHVLAILLFNERFILKETPVEKMKRLGVRKDMRERNGKEKRTQLREYVQGFQDSWIIAGNVKPLGNIMINHLLPPMKQTLGWLMSSSS